MDCPRCGQDEVQRCRIAEIDVSGWLCPECEALWLSDDVRPTGFEQLEVYLEDRGLAFSNIAVEHR
jgi:hypothetical protein